MEGKRKAAGANEAGPADNDDRAAKRRKMPGATRQQQHHPPSDYDLLKGESPQSTTAYGLAFLEQIRKTTDKNGRLIASNFETLLPQKENADYYDKTQLPISLEMIEQKLNNYEFPTLSELESYLKRMVLNAKEYFSRDSKEHEDAERLRKTLSNYMVKTNPAYQLIKGFTCQPTPLPEPPRADTESSRGDAREDEMEGTEEHDLDTSSGRRRPSRRAQRSSLPSTPKPPKPAKPDHEYEDVAYSRLNFQQAQEKIVEELIRAEDEEDPAYMKFESFLNLPSRSLKEYFNIITDPLSLRALQKLVKGIHGRQPPTGVSDFKGWAAFEEKASLLWNNAHYFNEEGSPIYNLATELKVLFEAELKEAKAAVAEPPQPKIKLKMAPAQESTASPAPGSKKITIHVGGSRGSAAASPVPSLPTDSAQPETVQAGAATLRNGNVSAGLSNGIAPVESTKSVSVSAASPSPSLAGLKQEPSNQQSPAVPPRLNGAPPHPLAQQQQQQQHLVKAPNGVPAPSTPGQPMQITPQGQVPPPAHPIPAPPPKEIWDNIQRSPGKGSADALITSVLIRTHPTVHVDKRFTLEVPAHPTLAQQTITAIVPSNQYKMQIIPRLPPFELQYRHFNLFVLVNGRYPPRSTPLPIPGDTLQLPAGTPVFDATLAPGLNSIEFHVVAAVPREQRTPNGHSCELEKITVLAHLLR